MRKPVRAEIEAAARALEARVLAMRNEKGVWEGHLSSSPLATAVASFALSCADRERYAEPIARAQRWIVQFQNDDGGWGDTDGADPSNLSTTLLCRSALAAGGAEYEASIRRAEAWIGRHIGGTSPERIAEAVYAAYGNDRTFAVPILTMAALARTLGSGREAWKSIVPLPFELAMLPRSFFSRLNLSVVSYALPALIAIGQAIFFHDPPANPLIRWMRLLSVRHTRKLLKQIQPENGGYLEAAPLTGFVVMSLASMEQKDSRVVKKGIAFLLGSMRPDGSWPIDTNLASWVTSLMVKALHEKKDGAVFPPEESRRVVRWYLDQQTKCVHPFTGARPGGWGWTDRPGSVPDADDTAGALIALYALDRDDPQVRAAALKGIRWLMNLQNPDGGIPTFCRGWGRLEFDRSSPDITAHAVAAASLWEDYFSANYGKCFSKFLSRAIVFLQNVQNGDGSFHPLWFGSPRGKDQKNPVYGTARVIWGVAKAAANDPKREGMIQRAVKFLLEAQNEDGGWGGQRGLTSGMEETSAAVEALLKARGERTNWGDEEAVDRAIMNGVEFMIKKMGGSDAAIKPSAIGLYFAKLWYYEGCYPAAFSLSALNSCLQKVPARL